MIDIISTLLQWLYNFSHWQYFGIFMIVWSITDLIWVSRWKKMLGDFNTLVGKPVIWLKDDNPSDPSGYPRTTFEQITELKGFIRTDPNNNTNTPAGGNLITWISRFRDRLFNPEHPFFVAGSITGFFFLSVFVAADAIVIALTMQLMGVLSLANWPPIFQSLEIPILGGTIASAIISIWVFIEMLGDENHNAGEFLDLTQYSNKQKSIFRLISLIVALIAIVVLLALAFQRLMDLGYLEATPTTQLILAFILYGLLAINNSLGAALMFPPGIKGLFILIYLLIYLTLFALPGIMLIVDFLWRLAYIITRILLWFLFTPIIAIAQIRNLFENL